jgi:N-acetylglucosamine kinase-like BadF-type ATPase
VLVAGTGAVAVAIDGDGTLRRADGWGMWLGDEGSGRWIGQRGLTAVLRAADGRGRATSLTAAANVIANDPAMLPSAIGGDHAPERRLAAFAPAVLRAAWAGDDVARSIVTSAIEHLVASTVSAATGASGRAASERRAPISVALAGGLTEDDEFRDRLGAAMAASGLNPVRPMADALAGAALLALRSDLPHERQVIRV